MPVATFPPGTAYNLPLQITQLDGITPSNAYLATDTLKTQLWAGDDQQLLATPAAAWNLTIGVPAFTVGFVPTDTAGMLPGVYRLTVTSQEERRRLKSIVTRSSYLGHPRFSLERT